MIFCFFTQRDLGPVKEVFHNCNLLQRIVPAEVYDQEDNISITDKGKNP